MIIIDLCDDALSLLESFIYHATSSWASGRMADVMLISEEELLYRVRFLDKAIEKAKWEDNWLDKQISFYD